MRPRAPGRVAFVLRSGGVCAEDNTPRRRSGPFAPANRSLDSSRSTTSIVTRGIHSIARNESVQMHVVPSVGVEQPAPHGALEREPGLLRDPAGRNIGHGVLDYKAMET